MAIKKYLTAFILFLFPAWLANRIVRLWGVRIEGRIGFSWIVCDHYTIEKDAYIQNFCYIRLPSLIMHHGAKIKKFSRIKGSFSMEMKEDAVINVASIITNVPALKYRDTKLLMGEMAVFGVSTRVDMTGNVIIGAFSVFAGVGSELWTHSYYHSKEVPKRFRIDGDIVVGKNVYIGSHCIITPGVSIADNISIGAGTVVSKSLEKSGLYVNQALRFLDFDPDEKVRTLERIPNAPADLVYRKKM